MSYASNEEERRRQEKSKQVKSPKHKVNTRKSMSRKSTNASPTAQAEHPHSTSVSFANTNASEIFNTTQQDEEIPTIEIGRQYIEDFYQRVTTIFYDTISLVFTENSKLAGIGQHHTDRMYDSYLQIQQEINTYLDSGVPADIVAQAIADNVELDYTIAMALSPPSDIIILFDQTVEQLQGIWAQINDAIEKRAQEMEAEYYGI